MRTYLYKLTSDRGGAPCAPKPRIGENPLLSLSICKPAIRRTAQAGDRILGITSRALAVSDGYPLLSVIYAARVTSALSPADYYAESGEYTYRPDCIYRFHQANGILSHSGRTRLHDDPAYQPRDIGRYPFYRNARTLLSSDFRYFGAKAVPIPPRFTNLLRIAEQIGQGHRVFDEKSPENAELDALFKLLWKVPTSYTPDRVEEETASHTPRPAKSPRRRVLHCA